MVDQWALGGQDRVKIASFLAVRELASAGDASLVEPILKVRLGLWCSTCAQRAFCQITYTRLISASKTTNVYTLPAINLMKNSASELFLLKNASAGNQNYQIAFGFIRQLALQLRKATKSQEKDAFQQVYNWQIAHAIDFWSIVLSSACDRERVATQGDSELRALIYPLVQTAVGIIK